MRIRIVSPRNRPGDAFALGLCYLAWGEYEACAAAAEGCQRESSFTSWITVLVFVLISTSITTPITSAPVSVQVFTMSTPVSFPSSASALLPTGTNYRSPTSLVAPGPEAGAARLRDYVQSTFISRTTIMSAARPGGGVPPLTPEDLICRWLERPWNRRRKRRAGTRVETQDGDCQLGCQRPSTARF